MARLNTRPSHASTAATSRYPSATPRPGDSSDQENQDPTPRVRMDKGKGRASDTPGRSNLPTPTSDISNDARGQKRKRVEIRNERSGGGTQHEDDEDVEVNEEETKFNRYFNPNQDPEERRLIKRKSRALERDFRERRDDLLRDNGDALTRTVRQANEIYKGVKQTNDATLDSRLLVNVSGLAYKKTAQLILGDSSTGVDVDEFLSKCITYMRNGGPLERNDEGDNDVAPTSSRRPRHRNRENSDSEEEEDDEPVGESLDWEVLGRHACFPYNARPCLPSFLLGPLSVEKKQRAQTQRRARNAQDTTGREARPEALTREDLSQGDENGLTAICTRINTHLSRHLHSAEQAITREARREGITDLQNDERGRALLRKHRMSDTGGVGLFDYVLNPRSFGQTVENLFYVSFLIKEGRFGIGGDSEGLPAIFLGEEKTLEQKRADKAEKHQAVFSLDYNTWQQLVEAFDIQEPLIPHRAEDESTGVQQRYHGPKEGGVDMDINFTQADSQTLALTLDSQLIFQLLNSSQEVLSSRGASPPTIRLRASSD